MELTVTRWKKYGKDRSYVGPEGGASLGYIDNLTGDVHVDDEGNRPAVLAALGLGPAAPAQEQPYAVVVERYARDLAENRAGTGAQQIARGLQEQAPVRTLLQRALGVHSDERAWRVGAKGERIVGQQLDRLARQGWTVVHDVPVGEQGANIDHVVVGPGGVFTVNSKYHVGKNVWSAGNTVMVSGRKTDYVRKARYEAERASKLLTRAHGSPVPVSAMVVIISERWTMKDPQPDGVLLLGPHAARRHLASLPAAFPPHELDRLAMWARRDTTWQS